MSTADKLNKLITTKAAIKQALIDKGQNPSDVFSTYADNIRSITSGGGGYEFDFTVLGYNQEECKDANEIANVAIALGDFTQNQITEAIAYGKELYDSNYSITNGNVDKNKLLFYPKLKLPFMYNNSKVLYIPNVEYNVSDGSTTDNAYTNYFLYKVGNINAVFTNSSFSQGFFSGCSSLREVGDINITGEVIDYNNFFYDCHALRKIGNMNTTGSTNFAQMFCRCVSLTTIPQLDTSSGTNFGSMFQECTFDVDGLDFSNATGQSIYQKPFYNYRGKRVSNIKTTQYTSQFFNSCINLESATNIDTSASTDYSFSSMFNSCSKLKEVSFTSSTSNITDFTYMFSQCKSLTSIPQLDTSSGTNFSNMFYNCSNLKRIEGISFKSLNKTVNYSYLTGSGTTTLRYALIKDIGTCTGMTSASFTQWYKWGIDDETNTDARQSLIDTLITYSFDRATAGYSTCTVKLLSNTKALLTEDEIAQITIKGYTIA